MTQVKQDENKISVLW